MILVFYTLFVEAFACSKSGSVWQKPDAASTLSPTDPRNLAPSTKKVTKPFPGRDTTLYPPFVTTTTRFRPQILGTKPPIIPPIIPHTTNPPKSVTTPSTLIQFTTGLTTTIEDENGRTRPNDTEPIEPDNCFMFFKIQSTPALTKSPDQDCDKYFRTKVKETTTTRRSTKKSPTSKPFWFW